MLNENYFYFSFFIQITFFLGKILNFLHSKSKNLYFEKWGKHGGTLVYESKLMPQLNPIQIPYIDRCIKCVLRPQAQAMASL